MIAVDDEDELVRHIQVVAGNRSLNGSAQAFRIEAVVVKGLSEPITRAIQLGESTKSIDELLETKTMGGKTRVSAALVKNVIIRELESGEKSREHLDAACAEELGVNPDTVFKSGLDPLKKDGRISCRKDGWEGGWFWSLSHTTHHPS